MNKYIFYRLHISNTWFFAVFSRKNKGCTRNRYGFWKIRKYALNFNNLLVEKEGSRPYFAHKIFHQKIFANDKCRSFWVVLDIKFEKYNKMLLVFEIVSHILRSEVSTSKNITGTSTIGELRPVLDWLVIHWQALRANWRENVLALTSSWTDLTEHEKRLRRGYERKFKNHPSMSKIQHLCLQRGDLPFSQWFTCGESIIPNSRRCVHEPFRIKHSLQ